ncbi:unnamed protein product [Auanema sp. JU1783]|nr:unnamed protein product [Auanema sp. JU1783]
MSSSVNGSVDFDDWLDIGDSSSLPVLKLDDVLNDVELLDDNLSFLDETESCSILAPELPATLPNSLYRYQLLSAISCSRQDSISHQLFSIIEKTGSPQAIAEHSGTIAIGTKKGMLLIYNEQNLLERFVKGEEAAGSVSCLAFSPDKRDITVGYSKGGIKVINVKTGAVKFSTSEATQLGHGVLQITYIGSNNSFLSLDSGGNVFEVRLSTSIVRRKGTETRCVFSGCNGEVVFMKYLSHSLLALMTVSKLMLVSTKFGGSVLCSYPLDFHLGYPPLIDFYNITQKQSSRELKLCVGRGTSFFIITLYPNLLSKRKKASVLNAKFILPAPVVAVQWFSPNAILLVDSTGKTSVIDSSRGAVLKAQSDNLELIFNTADYKGLSTGGNVSAALHCLAETVCYQTFCRSDSSVYILTSNGLYTINALTENDQVQLFYQRNDFASACLYLNDLLTKKSQPSNNNLLVLQNSLRVALQNLTMHIMDGCKNGKISELLIHYKKHIQVLLYASFSSKVTDVLFEYSWSRIEKDPLARTVLLEMLDEWVLDQALYDAPPLIISAYLTHLSAEGHFAQFQAAVVRFPIHSIDINHVMIVCRQNGLYDGIIYVFNKALGDYITPLEEMLEAVSSFVYRDVFTDAEVEQGNRLLLYVHCCLAGHAYPLGVLPKEANDRVPLEIFRCIVSLHGKDGQHKGEKYPYLRIMMLFDAQQFVNGICNSVDAKLFQEDDRLQRVVETLGLLSCDLRTHTILVHYLQLIIQLAGKNLILPPVEIVENVIDCLLKSSWQDVLAETTIVEILKVIQAIDRQRVLRLSQTPMRPRVCCFLYSNERKFIDLIKCCLFQENTAEVFPVIRSILESDLTAQEKTETHQFILDLLPKLMKLDIEQCANMILNYFPTYFKDTDMSVEENRKIHADLIENVMLIRKSRQEVVISGNDDIDELLMGAIIEKSFRVIKDPEQLDLHFEELLRYWQPIGSRTDFCLNIVSEHNSTKAMIILLEARGLAERAFELIFAKLSELPTGPSLATWTDHIMIFCNKNPVKAETNGWLLKVFKVVVGKLSVDSEVDEQLQTLCRRILSAGTIHVYELFTSLLECSSFAQASYKEYQSLLEFILSSCMFEEAMITEISHCMNSETSTTLRDMICIPSTKVCQATLSVCIICSNQISKSAFAFRCGHLVHMECDDGKKECPCQDEQDKFGQKKTSIRTNYTKYARNHKGKPKRNIFGNWDNQLQLTPH